MLKNMKISGRLLLGFGLVLLLLAGVAATGYWGTQSVNDQANEVLTGHGKVMDLSQRARAHILDLRRFEKDYFLNIGNKEAQTGYTKKWNDQREVLLARLEELKKCPMVDEQKKCSPPWGKSSPNTIRDSIVWLSRSMPDRSRPLSWQT